MDSSLLDIRGFFDIFIITNGRSTFEYCHKAIRNQNEVVVNVHIVKDKPWIEANNYCVKNCISGHFLRVDDDMILHPKALLFITYQFNTILKVEKRWAMRFWKLWEPWRGQPVNGIKLYDKRIVGKLGGFRANKLGKIDGTFREDVERSKFHLSADKSMFAVHSCSTFEENLRYAKMRGEERGKGFKKKRARLERDIGKYDKSVKEQYEMAIGSHMEDLNRRGGRTTKFYRFLEANNFLQKR